MKKLISLSGFLGVDAVFLGTILLFTFSTSIWVILLISLGLTLVITWGIFTRSQFFSAHNRSKIFLLNSFVATAFLIGILSIGNMLLFRHSLRFDLTLDHFNTLSKQAISIIKELPSKTKIILFDNPDKPVDPLFRDLLVEFEHASANIDIFVIDPDRNPEIAKEYDVSKYGQLSIVFGDSASGENRFVLVDNPTEEKIVNILKLKVLGASNTAYFITGHNELSPYSRAGDGLSQVAQAIKSEAINIDTLNIAAHGGIPADAKILIIAGPKIAPAAGELALMDTFFLSGGKLLFLLEPLWDNAFAIYLEKYGFRMPNMYVIDNSPAGKMFGTSSEMPIIMNYDTLHPVVQNFSAAMVFPSARPVFVDKNVLGRFYVTTIAKSTSDAYAETHTQAGSDGFTAGSDMRGPIPVVASCEDVMATPSPKIFVVGDPDFVTNRFLDLAGNRDFILNVLVYLAGNENLISIRPRAERANRLSLSAGGQRKVFYLSVIIFPFMLLIVAQMLYMWRSFSIRRTIAETNE